jgi:hypothetical protein
MAQACICDKCGSIIQTLENWYLPEGWVTIDMRDKQPLYLCPDCFNQSINDVVKTMKPTSL